MTTKMKTKKPKKIKKVMWAVVNSRGQVLTLSPRRNNLKHNFICENLAGFESYKKAEKVFKNSGFRLIKVQVKEL